MLKQRSLAFVVLAAALMAGTGSAIAANAPPRDPGITNRAVGVPLQRAMDAARVYNFPEALAQARTARAAEGITPAEIALVDRLIREWTEVSKNPEAIDEEIADQLREGRRSIGLLKNCADIAIVLTKAGKFATCPGAVAGQ